MELIRKRDVQKLDVDGFGEVYVRKPSAKFFLEAARVADSSIGPAERGWTLLIGLVAECVVDASGNPMVTEANRSELDPEAVRLVGGHLATVFAFSQASVLENSAGAPSGSSHTDLPVSSGAPTSTGF